MSMSKIIQRGLQALTISAGAAFGISAAAAQECKVPLQADTKALLEYLVSNDVADWSPELSKLPVANMADLMDAVENQFELIKRGTENNLKDLADDVKKDRDIDWPTVYAEKVALAAYPQVKILEANPDLTKQDVLDAIPKIGHDIDQAALDAKRALSNLVPAEPPCLILSGPVLAQ